MCFDFSFLILRTHTCQHVIFHATSLFQVLGVVVGCYWMKLDAAQRALKKVISNLNFEKSLYVYGGVGSGKTMMMKEFYSTCQLEKQYSHFHEYMRDFHFKMHRLRNTQFTERGTVVEHITSQQPRVVCLDEFQVTDISDAMILFNILRNAWNQKKFMFFTSNRHPTELYINGIQRDSFMPCIDLIMDKCIVHRLDNAVDYRRQKQLDKGYLIKSLETIASVNKLITDLTHNQLEIRQIRYMKRSIAVKAYNSIAVFDFNELCDANLGASDYLELASHFNIMFILNIPIMTLRHKAQARRFITLVDALYEKHISCVFLAESEPLSLFSGTVPITTQPVVFDAYQSPLFTGEEELFAFQRAASRLIEMSHFDYLNDQLKASIVNTL